MSVASGDGNGSVGSPYVVIHTLKCSKEVGRFLALLKTFKDLDQNSPGLQNVILQFMDFP